MISKYNRTFHFSFSPEIHSDDKTLDSDNELNNFINKKIVILEKLDGGNACLKNSNVFARTHSLPASHDSFSMLKSINDYLLSVNKLNPDFSYFGENMQGIHSLEYSSLGSPFYIFNIRHKDQFLSWENIVSESKKLNIPTVPKVFEGEFKSIGELNRFLLTEIRKPSLIDNITEKEGFVIRPSDSFDNKDFNLVVGKYVRKGHVQTDTHWSSNWKEANVKKDFWDNFYEKI